MTAYAASGPWDFYGDRQRRLFLLVLFLATALNNLDKTVITVVLEPIKQEFRVSDTALGLLSGLSFALLYATLGIPVAWLADRGNRKRILTVALTIWSGMTVVCGATQSFGQLLVARIGVGAGEAGGIPPAQSLIADYFPPARRARALTILSGSLVVGYLLGLTAGAQVAAHYGWRMTMVAAGAPGLVVAGIAMLLLDEPRLRMPPAAQASARTGILPHGRALLAKPSFVSMLIGITVYNMFSSGVFSFVPPYLMRVLKVPLGDVGLYYGALSASAALIGISLGGLLVGWLAPRDPRWQAWLCAAGLLGSLPFFVAAFLMDSFAHFLLTAAVGMVLLNIAYGVMFTALHAVCGSARRALAVAITLFASNLIGAGLGPVITGMLSDFFTARHGVEGLRIAMVIASVSLLVSALAMLHGGNRMLHDLED